MPLAPYSAEIVRRLVALDEAVASGGVLQVSMAAPLAGQPERVEMTVTGGSSGEISFAFPPQVARTIADHAEATEGAAKITAVLPVKSPEPEAMSIQDCTCGRFPIAALAEPTPTSQ